MDWVILILLAVVALLQIVQLVTRPKTEQTDIAKQMETAMKPAFEEERKRQQEYSDLLRQSVKETMELLSSTLAQSQQQATETNRTQLQQLEQRMQGLQQTITQQLQLVQETMNQQMAQLRQQNEEQLISIRKTVDEKLQESIETKMNESFQRVTQSLEQVYRGIGEMKTLAADVGGLKRVLSNVKTRGTFGEVQLAAILQEILAPEQYETNVETVPGSGKRIEFAIHLPGDDGKTVYLPIDSKFPADCYQHLQDAQDSCDPERIKAARKELETRLKGCAKDIRDKYVSVPYTTAFGILFLPFEGLYAEVVNSGLVPVLQRDYKISIAGPTTMAALLNALQMGFQTLAIQKHSDEVWKLLGAVKSEFDKFAGVLEKAQTHLEQAGKDLENLVGTRTRQMRRQLENVQKLEQQDTKLIGLPFDT